MIKYLENGSVKLRAALVMAAMETGWQLTTPGDCIDYATLLDPKDGTVIVVPAEVMQFLIDADEIQVSHMENMQ